MTHYLYRLRPQLFLNALAAAWFVFSPIQTKAVTCASGQTPITVQVNRPDGSPAPTIKVIVHQQLAFNGQPVLGTKLTSGTTNAVGLWQGCVATGQTVAVNVYRFRADRGQLTLWSDQIASTETGLQATANIGWLSVTFRDPDGNVLRKRPFAIYTQTFDASQRLILASSTAVWTGATTGDTGRAMLDLGPGKYVLRVQGSNTKMPIILSDRLVNPGAWTVIDEPLASLRVSITDGALNPLTGYPLEINTQATSADGRHIPGVPVKTGLRTNRQGTLDLYLPVGNYISTVRGSYKQFVFRRYSQTVQAGATTHIDYRLSGLRLLLRHGNGDLAVKGRFSLHEQQTNPDGQPGIATTIARHRAIGRLGYRNIYVPPGTYIVEAGGKQYEQIEVYPEQLTRVDVPRDVTYRPNDQITLKSPLANQRLTLRQRSMPNLAPVAGLKRSIGQAYRIKGQTMPAPYTVVFFQSHKQAEALGVDQSKLRIAYYSDRTQRWRLVGRYDRNRKQVAAVLGGGATVVLVEIQ